MNTSTATKPIVITWPLKRSDFTAAQQARSDVFAADIQRAWAAAHRGFEFHIWIDGRYHDSATTYPAALDEYKAQRLNGCRHQPIVIGRGSSNQTTGGVAGGFVSVTLPGDPTTEPWCPDHGYGCEPSNCPCGHTLRCDCRSIANGC